MLETYLGAPASNATAPLRHEHPFGHSGHGCQYRWTDGSRAGKDTVREVDVEKELFPDSVICKSFFEHTNVEFSTAGTEAVGAQTNSWVR